MRSKVRLAEVNDARELARLRWQYREGEQSGQGKEHFIGQCEEWLIKVLSAGQWIIAVAASADASLCGCMYLKCVEKVPVPGKIDRFWGYITNSYVSPGHRGAGLGYQLLKLLVESGSARNLEFLIVWPSEEAVSFYERAGFRLSAQVHDQPDDYPPLELKLGQGEALV